MLAFALTAIAAHAAFPTSSQVRAAFVALDASGNGAVGLDEWERGTAVLFQAADRDRNGNIDAADLPGSAIAPDTFLRVDQDRDGRLSREEFGALRRDLFRAADLDRNERLSSAEAAYLRPVAFGEFDSVRDGALTLDELVAGYRKELGA